jgi:hypothetical protein
VIVREVVVPAISTLTNIAIWETGGYFTPSTSPELSDKLDEHSVLLRSEAGLVPLDRRRVGFFHLAR